MVLGGAYVVKQRDKEMYKQYKQLVSTLVQPCPVHNECSLSYLLLNFIFNYFPGCGTLFCVPVCMGFGCSIWTGTRVSV